MWPDAVQGGSQSIRALEGWLRLVLLVVQLDQIGSKYRQRSAAAGKLLHMQKRGVYTVATAIAARGEQADRIDEVRSSCKERKTRQRSAVHRLAASVQAKARARRRVPVALGNRRQRPPRESERSLETEPKAKGPPPTPKRFKLLSTPTPAILLNNPSPEELEGARKQDEDRHQHRAPKAAGPPAKAGDRTYHIGRSIRLVNPTPEQLEQAQRVFEREVQRGRI